MYKPILRKKSQIIIICFLFSLFLSENISARKHWNRDYVSIGWVPDGNYISIKFEFFDSYFGPANEDGYLERCAFEYSTDGINYDLLMRDQTDDQECSVDYCEMWTTMTNKLTGANLVFTANLDPINDTPWPDNTDFKVGTAGGVVTSWLYIKWYVGDTYKNVKYIRITGKWHVNGVWPNEFFENEVYQTYVPDLKELNLNNQSDSISTFKTNVNTGLPSDNAIKVYSEADAIVINGADLGTRIHVNTTSGVHIKSIVTTNDLVKIKLPANQIYIVQVGKAHYKVAL